MASVLTHTQIIFKMLRIKEILFYDMINQTQQSSNCSERRRRNEQHKKMNVCVHLKTIYSCCRREITFAYVHFYSNIH